MKKIAIIDGMPLFYAATYGLVKEEILPTVDYMRAVLFNSLLEINSVLPNDIEKTFVAIDGQSNWRQDFFPEYKAKRKADRKKSSYDWQSFHNVVDTVLEEFERVYPAIFVRCPIAEGDDVIAYLCEILDGSKYERYIVASDKDLLQLQEYFQNVKQLCMRKQEYISYESRELTLAEHILKGDYSDGIPNILSDDDVYINENKKTIRFKKADYEDWRKLDPKYIVECLPKAHTKKALRNRTLIDFRCIPDYVKGEILKSIQESLPLNEKDDYVSWIRENNLEYIPYERRQELIILNNDTARQDKLKQLLS